MLENIYEIKNKYNIVIKHIVAVNNKGYIGKDNTLMWHNKEDLKHFKETTEDNVLVVGRKTFDSLPKSMLNDIESNREYIVVSSDIEKGLNLNEALLKAMFNTKNKEVYILGGANIYKSTLEMGIVDEILISKINNDEVGDVLYPTLDKNVYDNVDVIIKDTFELYKYKKKEELKIETNVPIMTGTFELVI